MKPAQQALVVPDQMDIEDILAAGYRLLHDSGVCWRVELGRESFQPASHVFSGLEDVSEIDGSGFDGA